MNETREIKMQATVIKKTSAIVLAASCLLFSATAFEAQAIEMRGSRSCGTWVSERSLKGLEAVISETWLVGYLSGMASASEKDFLKGTDNDSLSLWVDNYCRANPLKRTFDAGDALYFELIKQKKL